MNKLKKILAVILLSSSLLYVGCGTEISSSSGIDSSVVADAGTDLMVPIGLPATLDGSASTSDSGGTLTYSWSLVSVPIESALVDADISNRTTESPTFTPDVGGLYMIELVVSEGHGNSSPDYVYVSADIPVADAGADQIVQGGVLVTLDGSGSSLYGGGATGLAYAWSFDYVAGGSTLTDADISNTAVANPTFTPDAIGDYRLRLIVNDGVSDSDPDLVIISAVNTRPVADAGADQIVTISTPVILDGSGSSDADSDLITFAWSFESIPATSTATLYNATLESPTFTPDIAGNYNVKLIVNDDTYDSFADYVLIAAGVPLADAGENQILSVGTEAVLDGSGSSPYGAGPLSYLWTLDSVPAGSVATLSGETTVAPTFIPELAGQYVVSLVVTEGGVDSLADTVTVTASVLIDDIAFADASLATCVSDTAADWGASYASQLRYLNCSSMGISNIAGIGNLSNLESLYLNNNSIVNISELASMRNLYDLRMNMNIINDVSALSGMAGVYILDLFYNDISDISALAGMSNLTDLNLSYNGGLSNISDVAGFTGLTSLGLSGTSITGLSDISGLTGLRSLDLAYNNISDLSDLAGMTSLTNLTLNNNSISNIADLSGMTALERLLLEENTISDISALAGMTNMTDLQLRNNTAISDISALAGMSNLEKLDLYYCNVSDISALSGMTSLTNLDLNSNNASDISVLSGLTKINALSLQNNGISDISALSGMTDMRLLYISGNSITDISALSGMSKLTQLYISGNTIVDVSPLASTTSITDLLLGNNSITTGVANLVTLTLATNISLVGNDFIPCADLDTLTTALPGVVTEPATCIP